MVCASLPCDNVDLPSALLYWLPAYVNAYFGILLKIYKFLKYGIYDYAFQNKGIIHVWLGGCLIKLSAYLPVEWKEENDLIYRKNYIL